MTELDHLADHLSRTLEGSAWHGPAFLELLRDISAEQAAAHPIPNAHSIWEIVLHCTAWHRAVTRRLHGDTAFLEGDADWPPVAEQSERAWREAQKDLKQSAHDLKAELATLAPERLEEIVPGQTYTAAVMLHGLAGHDLYHAGQVALLKKQPQP